MIEFYCTADQPKYSLSHALWATLKLTGTYKNLEGG